MAQNSGSGLFCFSPQYFKSFTLLYLCLHGFWEVRRNSYLGSFIVKDIPPHSVPSFFQDYLPFIFCSLELICVSVVCVLWISWIYGLVCDNFGEIVCHYCYKYFCFFLLEFPLYIWCTFCRWCVFCLFVLSYAQFIFFSLCFLCFFSLCGFYWHVLLLAPKFLSHLYSVYYKALQRYFSFLLRVPCLSVCVCECFVFCLFF